MCPANCLEYKFAYYTKTKFQFVCQNFKLEILNSDFHMGFMSWVDLLVKFCVFL